MVAQDKRVFPEGQPVPQDQGHAARLTGFRHVEETMVHVKRPRVGGSLLACNANNGCLPHELGGCQSGRSALSLWQGPYLIWHINWLEMLAMILALKHFLPYLRGHHVLVRNRQHIGGLLYKPVGGSAAAPPLQAGMPDPSVGPREAALTKGSLHPAHQLGSRHPVKTGAEARGIEAPLIASGLSTEVVETVLQSRALSTRKLFLEQIVFTSWCGNHQLLPVNYPFWLSACRNDSPQVGPPPPLECSWRP